jgi:hypothetical protein
MPTIVSVNREHTENKHRVSFNLDRRPSPGVVEKINYGVLKIWSDGQILHVEAPEDGPELSAETVAGLEEKMAQGETDFEAAARKQAGRIDRIAVALGLGTD